MTKVFISYSHKDSEYAHKLVGELSRWGIEAWIDDRIDYGTQWPKVIEQNLDDCDAFILLMTPDAKESPWVINELAYIQNRERSENNKRTFPLLLDGKTWVSVAAIQYADIRGGILPPEAFFLSLGGRKPANPNSQFSEQWKEMENLQEQVNHTLQDVIKNRAAFLERPGNKWEEYIHGDDTGASTMPGLKDDSPFDNGQ